MTQWCWHARVLKRQHQAMLLMAKQYHGIAGEAALGGHAVAGAKPASCGKPGDTRGSSTRCEGVGAHVLARKCQVMPLMAWRCRGVAIMAKQLCKTAQRSRQNMYKGQAVILMRPG